MNTADTSVARGQNPSLAHKLTGGHSSRQLQNSVGDVRAGKSNAPKPWGEAPWAGSEAAWASAKQLVRKDE